MSPILSIKAAGSADEGYNIPFKSDITSDLAVLGIECFSCECLAAELGAVEFTMTGRMTYMCCHVAKPFSVKAV